MAVKAGRRFRMITPQIEEILKAVHFYRYVTAVDMAHLLYSPTSLTYVRERLSELAGGADFVTNQYLYRFRLPSITAGNSQRVFTLGSRGRDYLARELGLPAEWYFRPDKVKNMGYNQMLHNVILTRFLVAAKAWCAAHPEYELARLRICYELAEKPATVTITQDGQRRALKVIPDALARASQAGGWQAVSRAARDRSGHPVSEEIQGARALPDRVPQVRRLPGNVRDRGRADRLRDHGCEGCGRGDQKGDALRLDE